MLIQIKHRYTWDVIYALECADNTITKTVEAAARGSSYLSYADLSGADLRGADLSYANLPLHSKWGISFNDKGEVKIGCEKRTVKEWDVFFASGDVLETPRGTDEFKRIYAYYEAVKVYMKIMGAI